MANPRSVEAWIALNPRRVSELERDIMEHILVAMNDPNRLGLAAFEYELETAIPGVTRVSSVSATFTGLKAKRLIRPTGIKVPTPTGRPADRYELGDPLAWDAPVQPGVGQPSTREPRTRRSIVGGREVLAVPARRGPSGVRSGCTRTLSRLHVDKADARGVIRCERCGERAP